VTVMTPDEVAERWRVSVRHVERRELHALRFGRTVRLRLCDVEDFECRSISSSVSVADGPSQNTREPSASPGGSLRQLKREKRSGSLTVSSQGLSAR